jgi:AraC family transcriptional regulator
MSKSAAIVTGSRSGTDEAIAVRLTDEFGAVVSPRDVRLSQVRKSNRVIEMETRAYNTSESRVVPRDRVNCASTGIGQGQARADSESQPSIGGDILNSTVEITPSECVERLGTGWHGWFSESVHAPIGRKIEFRFQGPMHLLALYNEGVRRAGDTSIDGLHSSRLRSLAHKLTFVPAGCAYREWHETGASTRITFLYLDPAVFQKSDDGAGPFPPRIYFEDALVWETAAKLKNAIEGGQARSMPYLEALSGVLAHELSRVNDEIVGAPKVNRGGLASWQKRAVAGYIEEHLREQVSLLKLAELARISQHHFCRAFKQSFGIPPHQYLLQRRMEVAKLLLSNRTNSVTDIALSLGYAQTSSFSSSFRKTTGWTPTVYRREFK